MGKESFVKGSGWSTFDSMNESPSPDIVRANIALTLKDFAQAPEASYSGDFEQSKLLPSQFPVPEVILIVLRDILGFRSEGFGEKVRWKVYFSFRGWPIIVELRKFGLTYVRPTAMPEGEEQEAIGKLKRATTMAEPILSEIAEGQGLEGNVTLANFSPRFDGRYRFFREQARICHEKKPTLAHLIPGASERDYFTVAMVDAYFNRLEHACVLMLAFLDFEPGGGGLLRVISGTWEHKLKAVTDNLAHKDAKAIFDALKRLREQYRNPLAHGGFEKGVASLYFHLPKIGAIPGNLSRIADSWHFMTSTIEGGTYADTCSLFDRTDDFLANFPNTKYAYKFAMSGLDVAFDSQSREKYRNAMKSESDFDDLMKYVVHVMDMHANMDY